MGNALAQNPMHIDTPGATSAITDTIVIQTIFWSSNDGDVIAAADKLTITNAAGAEILNVVAVAETDYAGGIQWAFPTGYRVKGITVTVMGGGELYIYLADDR